MWIYSDVCSTCSALWRKGTDIEKDKRSMHYRIREECMAREGEEEIEQLAAASLLGARS